MSNWSSDLDDINLSPSDFSSSIPLKKVPHGDIFSASRGGDVERLRYLLDSRGGDFDINARDVWDSVALYYACLAGHLDAARMLLESGAICDENTFDGDRCHYAALNLKVRKLLKSFEARPPPLPPLQAALRDTFLGISTVRHLPPDVVFFVQGTPLEAHRLILSARSPFFKNKFQTDWKDRKEVRFSKKKLYYPALYSLIHFFYCDRLEIAVDDMEDLVRICKVCKCESLHRVLNKELVHQKYADYKALRDIDDTQKRFILQGHSLPEEDRLSSALHKMLQICLGNSSRKPNVESGLGATQITDHVDDLADVCVRIDNRTIRCHQVILASRSEYFRARLSRMKDFLEGNEGLGDTLPCLEEHDLSMEAFEKMIEYMYTDCLKDIDPERAEEMFDAASRYLLFPLKRAVADALLPHLETVSPAELCHWLIISDMYDVFKLREYCLDTMAVNFEIFVDSGEFRAMILTLPPPSGDSSVRTSVPSGPGGIAKSEHGNILDDLREKWLEGEAGELDKRDESAVVFDKRLEMLMEVAKQEK